MESRKAEEETRGDRGKNDEDKEELDRRRKLWESRLKQREGKGTGERGP